MSETEGAKPTPPANPEPTSIQPEPAKEPIDWEKHARTWENRAKENKAELDANKAELETMKADWQRLSQVFAPEQAQPKPEDMIAALSARIDASERESAVNSLARRLGITSDDDVALLRSVADPAQREALAVRLKPTDPSIPPDPGQGPRPTAPQSAQDAEYATFFPPERK